MRSSARGMTLLEILIATGIMLVLLGIVSGIFTTFNRTKVIEAEASRIASIIKSAHDRTLSSEGGSNFGVHFASGTVTIFRGSAYVEGAVTNEIFPLSSAVTVTPSLLGGGNDIIFVKIKGTTAQSGTVTVSAYGQSKIIDVTTTGVVYLQ